MSFPCLSSLGFFVYYGWCHRAMFLSQVMLCSHQAWLMLVLDVTM